MFAEYNFLVLVMHPIEESEVLGEAVSSRDIVYTRHFEDERLPYRENVSKSLIEKHLRDFSGLVDFEFSEDGHDRAKYELLFDKSNKYYLKVVLSMDFESVYIVTAHVINKAKRDKSKMIG
jgi:hypothetical protein